MSKNFVAKILVIIYTFVLGCGANTITLSPLASHYDSYFSDFKIPEKDKIKNTFIKRNYQTSFDQVWEGTLTVLSQYAIIVNASKESGVLQYIDVDGLLLDYKFSYAEFPFTVLIENQSQEVNVYMYPMVHLFEGKIPEKILKVMKLGFTQKGEEFLERLSTQLTAQNRWPWLTK